MLRRKRDLIVEELLALWDDQVGERTPDLGPKLGTFVNLYGADATKDQLLAAADGEAEDSEAVVDDMRDRLRRNRNALLGTQHVSRQWRPR